MFSTTVVTLVISLYAVEILAVDGDCSTPYNSSPIENCCDLKEKFPQFTFGEYTVPVNKPNVYKLKKFLQQKLQCSTSIQWIL